MNRYLSQFLLLAGLTLFGFAIYVLLFWAGVATSITILFYRGIALALVAALITLLAALWLAAKTGDSSLPFASVALSLSFNICFLVLLPVTVDRSVSVYLLSTVEQHQDSGIGSKELQHAFIDDYVVKMGAIDRRIDEQKRSHNVTVGSDGKVRLTPQGRRFMALSRLVARVFGTDPRFVEGSSEKPAKSAKKAVLADRIARL